LTNTCRGQLNEYGGVAVPGRYPPATRCVPPIPPPAVASHPAARVPGP